jgi:hypothetical protein
MLHNDRLSVVDMVWTSATVENVKTHMTSPSSCCASSVLSHPLTAVRLEGSAGLASSVRPFSDSSSLRQVPVLTQKLFLPERVALLTGLIAVKARRGVKACLAGPKSRRGVLCNLRGEGDSSTAACLVGVRGASPQAFLACLDRL